MPTIASNTELHNRLRAQNESIKTKRKNQEKKRQRVIVNECAYRTMYKQSEEFKPNDRQSRTKFQLA